MEKEQLKFIKASPPASNYLTIEAWIDAKQVAELYNENGIWNVYFYPQDEKYLSISWEIYQQIHQRFAKHIEQEKNYPPM